MVLYTSKSSTKASGDPPEEVKLWDDFLGSVNNNTFDQEKKFQRPIFITDFIKTCEEIVREAFNVNVCMVLNRVLQDVQFALRNVKGTGNPDYCCHLVAGDKLLITMEVRGHNVLITSGRKISDLYNDKIDAELAPKVRQIIQQLYNYMIENTTKYGALSTYNDHWFFKRDRGILYISEAVNHGSTHPRTLKSYAYLVELAKNDTYSSDPRIIEKTDNLPYPFRKPRYDDNDDPSSSHNLSKQSSSKQSSSEQSYSSTSNKSKHGKQSMEAQRFNYQDFKYISILSAGENNKKVLECEFHGKTIALKSTDLTKKPKCLDEFLNEVEIYKVLAKLQGKCIPELLFYGNLANGMSLVMGMTIVGTPLDHHRINKWLKNRAIMTLKKVHKYNVLHNDIRKENILIDEKGHVYLIDFGLSIQTYDENMFHEEEAQLEHLLNSYLP
nr:3671_t:CDS:1 [Entrophospora candida]